ncbi:hypothetical protein BASA81_005823 [Batrachochytrium salamandrivorans]|nr:hypothetical protein BASA81_005823 [Batrachochytrium salamandrivorans]
MPTVAVQLQERLSELLGESEKLAQALEEFSTKPNPESGQALAQACGEITQRLKNDEAEEEEEIVRLPSKTEIFPLDEEDEEPPLKRAKQM